MQRLSFALDPRYFQVIFQAIFLAYGILFLHWSADWQHYLISIGGCLLFQYAADSIKAKSGGVEYVFPAKSKNVL